MGIFHQSDGKTKALPIDGPPFQMKIEVRLESVFTIGLFQDFFHRPGQDPASLEQHYDLDTGYPARAVDTED